MPMDDNPWMSHKFFIKSQVRSQLKSSMCVMVCYGLYMVNNPLLNLCYGLFIPSFDVFLC